MKLRKLLLLFGLLIGTIPVIANPVIVKMNAVSRTMTIKPVDTDETIEIGTPTTSYEYSLELNPGKYEVTGYGTDGNTVNGKIMINVTDSLTTQQFTVITCTAYVTNKLEDGSTPWNIENGDYALNVKVNTREGEKIEQTPGTSVTANRYTFLALNGNSYNVAFEPNEKHQAEGYMTLYRGGTLTANVNVTGAIPMGGDFSITIPAEAELEVGMKFTHFTDFTRIEPKSVENANGGKTYNYILANGQVYNYRTWKSGGLTHGGYFTMNATDSSKCPIISFTDSDYAKADPKAINHSPQSNNGYETGDLLLNINPEHHLKLNVNDVFLVHGMRMWEISDNSTNNYFFEPDFHYTVLDIDFKPSSDVIEIENCLANGTSAWSKIKAKGKGTAIVMVTYDGINLNYYNNADKKDYLGGEYWGAIWPENTGVFVVTVGEDSSSVVPNMTVNEEYNMDALRLAGNNVDAEHDVFYYLDSEEGFNFTFKPESVASIDIATPVVTETEMKYSGFTDNGVVKNEDGSYTILLKEGKTIVRMTDANGISAYQVLRAKPCHREITNQTRPGSGIFQPGDKVKIQYSGLFHPANKIAGIYNMSAYITYNGKPNGSSLILGSGQYTFGSAASAQAVTVEIPADFDIAKHPQLVMDEGVIQVNGYGDPIGNHRNTSPTAGRSPNFTAVPHKTYFGSIPDIKIDLNPIKYFRISLEGAPQDADITLSFNGEEVVGNDEGFYIGTYGTYSIVANAAGYKCFRCEYTIGDDTDDIVVFPVEMQMLGNAWDGKTKSEPRTNEDGVYQISNGAELAWFAGKVNSDGGMFNAELTNDIELGNFDWNPIGVSSSKSFAGSFKGHGHVISEIYVDENTNYKGLFGYVKDAAINELTVSGFVAGKQYVGGLAGYVNGTSVIDRCANRATVKGSGTYAGGLVGYLYSATAVLTNSFNAGNVNGTTYCGGIVGGHNANATMSNIFNVGTVEGTAAGACVGGTNAKNNITKAFATVEYQITTGQTTVTPRQMASGEIAYLLGDAFTQTIGEDPYPVFDGLKVYYDGNADEYYNLAIGFNIDLGDGTDEIIIAEEGVTMPVKSDYKLSLIADPVGARLSEITWTSGNEDVARVDKEGNLSALAKGTAVISATAVINGERVTSSCHVTVVGARATELTICQKDISLDINDTPTFHIIATFGPEYAEEPKVIWSSDDERVVVVDHNGTLSATLKAMGDGMANIRIEHADNPAVFDTCTVHVTGATASVANLFGETVMGKVDIFDLNGRIVRENVNAEYCQSLAPGIYIIRCNDLTKTVLIK